MSALIIIAIIAFVCILVFRKKPDSGGKATAAEGSAPAAPREAAPVQAPSAAQDVSAGVGDFPTYTDAIDDEMFVCSPQAREIIDQEPFSWEYVLFAQSIEDDLRFLSAFRKQTRDNPFVRKIGTDSEGEPYIRYLGSMLANVLLETERFTSKFAIYGRQFNEALGEPGEDGDADALMETAVHFMEPYIAYLSFYNDLCTIRSPEGAEGVHSGMKQVLESLLDSLEGFYNGLSGKIRWMVAHPEQAEAEGFNLTIALKADENAVRRLHESMKQCADTLAEARISRIRF